MLSELSKNKKIGLGIGAAAVCVAVIGGAAFALAPQPNLNTNEQTSIEQKASMRADAPQKVNEVGIGVKAKDWDENSSSPVIVHIQNTDGTVDYYHAYPANKAQSLKVKDQGDYKLSFISPVNADGSIYRTGDEITQPSNQVDAESSNDANTSNDGDTQSFEPSQTFDKVEASDVTAEDLQQIMDDTSSAIDKGDSTLTGDNGKQVVDKVKDNIKANDNADESAIDQTADDAAQKAQSGTSGAQGEQSQSGSSQSAGDVSDATSSDGGSADSSDSSSDSSDASTPSEPEHQAVWVVDQPAYDEQVQTQAAYDEQVLVQAAYDEPHYETKFKYVVSDGSEFSTPQEADNYVTEQVDKGNDAAGSWKEVPYTETTYTHHDAQYDTVHHDAQYTTVHHDEVGHWE